MPPTYGATTSSNHPESGGRWRARYRHDQDREHSRHFDRKIDGETWLAEQTVAVATGAHVSPRLSKITVQAFYDLGRYQIGQVSHSHVEAWIKRMADQPLAPGTVKTRYSNVRGVFRAAVRDRLIVRDPTEAVRLPRQRRADASRASRPSMTPTARRCASRRVVRAGW